MEPVKDLSGNGNNGTNNGAVPTLGKRGQALSFNGTSQYANMGNATSVQLSLDGSVSAWVKTTGSGSYKCIVAKQGNYGFFNNDGIFGIYDWGALAFRSSGVTINDGEWHFVTMTFQDGVSNGTVLYVDGVEKLITTMTISSQSNNLLVGYGNATGQYLNGSIDEVRVYNRVLSAAEVGQLYQTGTMKIVPGLGTAKIK